jgi:thiamine transporter ThiT
MRHAPGCLGKYAFFINMSIVITNLIHIWVSHFLGRRSFQNHVVESDPSYLTLFSPPRGGLARLNRRFVAGVVHFGKAGQGVGLMLWAMVRNTRSVSKTGTK